MSFLQLKDVIDAPYGKEVQVYAVIDSAIENVLFKIKVDLDDDEAAIAMSMFELQLFFKDMINKLADPDYRYSKSSLRQ